MKHRLMILKIIGVIGNTAADDAAVNSIMKISDKIVSSSVCGVADADAAADDSEGCGVANADADAASAMGCYGEAVADSTRLQS